MDTLKLEVPRQAPNPNVSALALPARLKNWLAALPLGNAGKTGHELLTVLHQINRAMLAAAKRYAILEEMRPLLADLLDILHKQYSTAPIPLPEKPRATADLVSALLTEAAYGYKAVVLELSAAPLTNEVTRNVLATAVHRVLVHLSRLLVEAYGIYAPEPKRLWLEVNELYRYAERNRFHSIILPDRPGAGSHSIDHAYRRLLLLALANPYHLMQGETLQVYQELDKWAGSCRLIPLPPGASVKGKLFIDLDADAPPRYAPNSFDLPPPADGRIIEISPILGAVEQRIKEVMLSHKTEAGQLSLMGRKLRNMYKRLAEAWGIRSERLAERRPRNTPIEVAVGISACHYFASGGTEFTPEIGEIELRRGGNISSSPGLSLMGADEMPWLNEDQALRLVTGIVQPRTSQFEPEKALHKDVWIKVYSTQAHHESQKAEAPNFASTIYLLVDESRGGLAIECNKNPHLRTNVGEVVAFKNPRTSEWSIGTIRWLRITPKEELGMGIRVLADDAMAVAVRGVRGAGAGSEYFRALLIPRLDPTQYPTTLITPAAIYDVDSVVLLNTGDSLIYAHLMRLMDATNAYSLFQFQIVAPPDGDSGPSVPERGSWAL